MADRNVVSLALSFLALGLLGTAPSGCVSRETQPQEVETPIPAPPTLSVTADGSGDFTSVVSAVEAAPEGAIIRIGPGTFQGTIRLAKSLTLEGAGANATTLTATVYDPQTLKGLADEFRPQEAMARTDEDRRSLAQEFDRRRRALFPPPLRVEGDCQVVVRRLTLTGLGPNTPGGVAPGAVVEIAGAEVRMEESAVAGSPASGVVVGPGSNLTIEGCLVAGVWGTGIAVEAGSGAPSTVAIRHCDIRNCRHRGITIGPGNREVSVEGCRISGSSWHGIRYDDASPVVRGNLIFANVRSGIYASGKTEGRIEGNLFYGNGMSDVSCWFGARDLVEGNSFVASKREAVAILGASDPIVRRNVFSDCRTAVTGSAIADSRQQMAYEGGGTLEGNVFWKNGADFRILAKGAPAMEDVPLPAGNLVVDPGFAAPDRRDYSLDPTSAARAAGAGAVTPPTFESPWPLRPQESETAPQDEPPTKPQLK